MKNLLIAFVLSVFSLCIFAQDVIVKKDGSTILSKVLEVNSSDIKYKKFSNQSGPTYIISVTDVQTVNYENGEIDDFNANSSKITPSSPLVDNILKQNIAYIEFLNQSVVRFAQDPKDKQANMLFCTLGVKNDSQLLNEEMKILLQTGDRFSSVEKNPEFGQHAVSVRQELQVTIQNTSNKTLYIDLGNSFFKRNGEASPFYIPSSTSSTTSTSSGTGVNMGAVAGALGVGGAVGTLANGINVGGGSSHETTNTVYSQRIIAVPPMSTKKLETQQLFPLGCRFWNINGEKYYKSTRAVSFPKQKLKWGETLIFNEFDSPVNFGIYITYAEDESCRNTKALQGEMYMKEIQGVAQEINFPGVVANMRYMTPKWENALYFVVKN